MPRAGHSSLAFVLIVLGAGAVQESGAPVLDRPPTEGAHAPAASSRIPFTLVANKVILPITVGDSRELKVILDTGMFEGLLLYNRALLDSIALLNPVAASIGGAGSGPGQTAVMSDSMSFRIGDVVLSPQRVIILQGQTMSGFASDGVCGQSLFGSRIVELDYDQMTMILHERGPFTPDSSWTALPLTFRANWIPWIDVALSVAGTDSVMLSCYVDLASSETIEILMRDDMKVELPEGTEEVYLGRGLSGDIHGKRGKVAWAQIGPHRVADLTMAAAPAEVRSKQPGADAVVGNGLLHRFNCVFDYGAGRLYLRPRSQDRERG